MEMIIQNETGNFTLHVRISDSKEYDFLKDVTELARKYDFENDDFEIEDPEKETDQVPETTISEAAEEYKGFLHIRCEECEETISYNAKEPETQHKCKKCGHVTQLRALKPMYAECKACGSSWKYMTNRNTAELTQECLQCGNLIDMEMNSRRTPKNRLCFPFTRISLTNTPFILVSSSIIPSGVLCRIKCFLEIY